MLGSHTTTASSPVTVTSSSQYTAAGVSSQHHLMSTRDQLSPPASRPLSTQSLAQSLPTQAEPPSASPRVSESHQRSRSRTVRRSSGAAAGSSTSPSNDSRAQSKKKEPQEQRVPRLGTIGVCALDSKARSKPSRNILKRLNEKEEFEIVIFGDKVILDEDIENWPLCDYLISFFSDGFPLDKAIAYWRLRKPFCVNDLPMQTVLWDRRTCLQLLDKLQVPTPKRVVVTRDGGPRFDTQDLARHVEKKTGIRLLGPEDGTGGGAPSTERIELSEDGDTITVDGVSLQKPFVEKPVSGEDHNINIYYSSSQGGGGRRLFRKVNNKSSEKDDSLFTPRAITDPDSSYIFEQYLSVIDSEDVKAYTVGPDYCHAETRRSPAVDGVVKRNTHGKEVRYITKLREDEAAMAARICNGFGQTVCGFDMLRTDEKTSFVIDVNGWSFVKDNNDYYDKCASILKQMFVVEKQRRDGRAATPKGEPLPPPFERRTTAGGQPGHRAVLKSILRSPSMSRLAGIATSNGKRGTSSPGETTPAPSSPSPEKLGRTTPILSAIEPLPPAAITGRTSDPEVVRMKSVCSTDEDFVPEPAPQPASKSQWKLKGMVSVIRHADRTPKQKHKFTFHTKPFVDLLKGHAEEVLLVGGPALESVGEAVNRAIEAGQEDPEKLKLLKTCLAKKGGLVGTKVQIKPMFRKRRQSELPPKLLQSNPLSQARLLWTPRLSCLQKGGLIRDPWRT